MSERETQLSETGERTPLYSPHVEFGASVKPTHIQFIGEYNVLIAAGFAPVVALAAAVAAAVAVHD